ncbi:unnamed protein product [Hymenolepis diminuta]|uniref:TYR_PHOSPHATASE_2 domain-containing protein n=1 Tax=Hymenolepis diminuta TaxID=6216 RepID=A0A0R3SXV8_HYMDI|nr:unnamed protein product [Hymenolepis diminuta]VUZ50441.1 unnamed protein product [Hymenolepis diminuta]
MIPEQPVNFSWISDTVAGLAFPSSNADLDYLVTIAGISNLITLIEDIPSSLSNFPSLKHYHFPIPEFEPPSLDLLKRVVEIILKAEEKGEKCGVHCLHGRMRTATVLAAYLTQHEKIDGKTAVDRVCKMRPTSEISPEREKVVCEYSSLSVKKA